MFAGGEAAKPTVAKGSATGEYDVTFDRPVTIAQSQLDAVGTDADQLLMKLGWDATSQTLTITATAWASAISRTDTGADGAQASIVLVRTPTPKLTNKCISVSAPAPYTKLNGITTVSGKAQLFEAGPMTILARAPGEGTTSTRVKTASSALEPYSKDVNLPLLDAPEEGYISAFEPSAKDGCADLRGQRPGLHEPGRLKKRGLTPFFHSGGDAEIEVARGDQECEPAEQLPERPFRDAGLQAGAEVGADDAPRAGGDTDAPVGSDLAGVVRAHAENRRR